MSDSNSTATTALVYDATGAKQGAADFADASQKIINANNATGDAIENATKRMATSTSSQSNYLNRLTAQLDPLGAAVTKASNQLSTLNDIVARGGPNAAQAAALIGGATANLNKAITAQTNVQDDVTASAKSSNFAVRDFGIQIEQFFSQVATGQPILTAFIQQGHQIADVALATGTGFGALGAAAKSAWGFVTSPIGLAIAGVAAVGGAIALAASHAADLASQARELNTAITGAGRAADISTAQLQNYITTLDHAGVAESAAASIVTSLARNPSLSQTQIGEIVQLTPDVATGSGQDAAATAALIANSFTGGYDAVKKLDDVLHVFTADQLTAIRNADQQGQTFTAQQIVVDALSARYHNLATTSLSETGQAFREIDNGWDDFWNSVVTHAPNVLDLFARIATTADGLAAPDLPLGLGNPALVSNAPPSPPAAPAATAGAASLQQPASAIDQQTKLTNDLTQAYKDQQTVLAAGLPIRDQVRARIEAENTAAEKGLDTAHTQILVNAAVGAAAAQAGDAVAQQTAAMERQGSYTTILTDAMNQGRAAIITATAATEAHEKAVTTAGVSELAYAQAILNSNAAAEATKGIGQVQDLQDQVNYTKQLVDAENLSDRAAHYAELSVNVDKLTSEMEAYRDATTDPNIKAALDAIIGQTRSLAFEQDDLTSKSDNLKAILSSRDALTVLAKQGELIGTNATETARQVAELQTLLQLEQQQGADPAHLTAEQQQRIALAGSVAAQTAALQQQQQVMQDLGSAASQIFSTIGDAIAQAFVQGQGAAVNWGNVTRAVISQVIQKVGELAIVNPILNSLFGQNNTTLTAALAALGSSGSGSGSSSPALQTASLAANANNQAGTSAGGSSIFSDLSTGASVVSAGNTLSNGWLLNSLGITGENGLLSNLGLTGNGGLLSNLFGSGTGSVFSGTGLLGSSGAIANLLNAPLWTTGLGGTAAVPEGAISAEQLAALGSAGPSIGSLLSGAGVGFGAGSLAGGFVQSALDKTGPAPEVGAALGTAAGLAAVALAPETFGTSLLLGGLLGGTGGGILGGAIGPKRAACFGKRTIVL